MNFRFSAVLDNTAKCIESAKVSVLADFNDLSGEKLNSIQHETRERSFQRRLPFSYIYAEIRKKFRTELLSKMCVRVEKRQL